MANTFQAARSDQAGFNIKDYFFKYLRFLPLFILSLLLAFGVAYLYLRYKTPTYRSHASMFLKDDKSKSGGTDKFQELFVDDRTKNITNEIEYLTARPLMERVVEALNLNYSFYAKGKVKELNVYKATPFQIQTVELNDSVAYTIKVNYTGNSQFEIDGIEGTYTYGQTFKVPAGVFRLIKIDYPKLHDEYKIHWAPTPQMAGRFVPSLVVVPKIAGGGILSLSHESDNPQLSADILNQLMREYQKATIEDKNSTTQQTLVFLNGRLQVIQREVDSITRILVNFQASNGLGDLETYAGMLYQKAQESDREKIDMRIELEKAQSILSYLSNTRNRFERVPTTFGIADPTLNGLISAYNEAQLERKMLVDGNIPADHPNVKLKDDQIEKLRLNILENVRQLRNAYNESVSAAESKNRNVEAQLRSLPVKQQILIEIKRQQESKLAILKFLNEKKEESAISQAATISNIKILERAYPNDAPVKPKPSTIYGMALLIGLIIPAIFVLIREMMDDKITVRSDIEKATDVPILGEVGHSTGDETLIVTPMNRSFVAEQFRIIRSNLQFVLTQTPKPVILVTSSFSGEGKSFASTNIGGVMALAGKRTVVLEFDVRKPKVLMGLGMTHKAGLTNYLLGKIKLEEMVTPVPNVENLFVVPCGPVPPNPAELLLDEKMANVFEYLRANFDIVIMDTAPVGMVGDAITLGQYADCSIYIVRQGVTHKKQIELIEEYHREQKLPRMSIILNDVKLMAGYGYYGYGRYGYGYGRNYGYGYYDDQTSEGSLLSRWFGWNGKKKKSKQKKAGV